MTLPGDAGSPKSLAKMLDIIRADERKLVVREIVEALRAVQGVDSVYNRTNWNADFIEREFGAES